MLNVYDMLVTSVMIHMNSSLYKDCIEVS